MFSNVLVATDISQASDSVIGCLHGLRPLGTKRIILTHALGIRHLEELKYMLTPFVEPRLQQQKQALEGQGFTVEIVIAPGVPSWEIHRLAMEKQATMIVIGSHGVTLARDVLLGSVASEIIHQTELPVFVAQLQISDEIAQRCAMICEDFHKHILFATDFSDIAERAFTYVEQIVISGGRRVTLLHVQNQSHIKADKVDEFNHIDRERMERMANRLKELNTAEVRIELEYGMPKQKIVQCIEQGDYSLVIMGTQGRSFFGRLLTGSVAYHVTRNTVVPTLLIPPLR